MKVLSLFDGIATGYEALLKAGIKVDKYYASEIDNSAIKIALKNHPDIIEIGDVTQIDFNDYKDVDLVLGGSPCFVAGTLITTKRGLIPIEEVEIGDYVLTHTNEFHKVLNTMSHEHQGIYVLNVFGAYQTELTGNHRVYVRDRWKKYDKEKKTNVWEYSKPYWKAVQDCDGSEMILLPVNKNSINIENLTDDECWLIGRFIADGYLQCYKRKDRKNSWYKRTAFTIGNKKVNDFMQHITNYKMPGHKEGSITRFITLDKRLYSLCEQCGKYAHGKKIPQFIMDLPVEKLKIFLDGYISGDGNYYPNKDMYRATSVSKILIYQLKQCVHKCFNTSGNITMTHRNPLNIIEGRIVNQRDSWCLDYKKQNRKQDNSKIINDELWSPIKSIKYLNDRIETVYNFEVEKDNSYTANCLAVHNCQGFSVAGKQLAFDDPRSKLYFEFERAIKTIQPKYFLLENVKMKQEFQDIITERLGCEPIAIDSALVSAQRRKRLYWTNIPGVQQPENKGIMLKDIVHENEPNFTGDLEKYKIPIDKSLKICDEEIKKRKIAYFGTDSQGNRVYSIHDKSVTLCGQAGGKGAKTGLYLFGCITPDRVNKRQNGQRFNDGQKFYTLTAQDQHGVLIDGYIRKLSPVECERLQCLPDGYTEGVSDNQRIRALGNGWTCDVIAHILSYIPDKN